MTEPVPFHASPADSHGVTIKAAYATKTKRMSEVGQVLDSKMYCGHFDSYTRERPRRIAKTTPCLENQQTSRQPGEKFTPAIAKCNEDWKIKCDKWKKLLKEPANKDPTAYSRNKNPVYIISFQLRRKDQDFFG